MCGFAEVGLVVGRLAGAVADADAASLTQPPGPAAVGSKRACCTLCHAPTAAAAPAPGRPPHRWIDRLTITTIPPRHPHSQGVFAIELYYNHAPRTCHNIAGTALGLPCIHHHVLWPLWGSSVGRPYLASTVESAPSPNQSPTHTYTNPPPHQSWRARGTTTGRSSTGSSRTS